MNKIPLIIGPSLHLHGVGGVTIHVQRLRDFLENNHYCFQFKDYKTNSFFSLLCEIKKFQVIHFHVSNPFYLFILVLSAKILRKTVLLTLHGNYGRFGWFKNLLVRNAICMATVPIVINEMSFQSCRSINIHTRLIPAFIPPQKEEGLQKEIVDLCARIHGEEKKIAATNASNTAFDKVGNDIYGIDFLVEYFKENTNMCLIVSDPTGNYKKRFSDINSESVYFIDCPHSFYELLKHVDFFIRNTSTDGDAISVKEALYLGVPTLCSDVVDRPKGVKLFTYSHRKSFEKCLMGDFEGNYNIENGADAILRLYQDFSPITTSNHSCGN